MFEVIEIYTWDDVSTTIIAQCELKADAERICESLKKARIDMNLDKDPYSYVIRDAVTNGFSIPRMLGHISEDICCNYCKYHDGVRVMRCNYTDKGGICPLDQINW